MIKLDKDSIAEFKKKLFKFLYKALKEILWWITVIVIASVVSIALRVFLLCSFKIPSWSMFPTVEGGDFVLVNKQIPGPRVYPDFPRFLDENGKVKTKRFKGIRKIRRNDIITFNFPYSNPERIEMNIDLNYMKRCVALPGDSLVIENGFYKVLNAPDVEIGYKPAQEQLSLQFRMGRKPDRCFPYDTVHYNWNLRDLGPYLLPKEGLEIELDTVNYILYRKLITYETDSTVTAKDGKILLGDSIISTYCFRMNYYFMAGDNAPNSRDSRYLGLIPEDHIIGKAIIIWKSQDLNTKKYRWKRFFKLL
jgi:signal peptidase I